MRTVCGWWGVVIASVATAAVAPALRGPEDTQTDADAQTIDDRKIARIVERDGGALLEPGGLLSAEELLRRTDLEEETVNDVLKILAAEFEED